MPKHIDYYPGPWKSEGTTVKAITHGNWFAIANTRYPKLTLEAQLENAKVIALAPTMFETLHKILDRLGTDPLGDDELADLIRETLGV